MVGWADLAVLALFSMVFFLLGMAVENSMCNPLRIVVECEGGGEDAQG